MTKCVAIRLINNVNPNAILFYKYILIYVVMLTFISFNFVLLGMESINVLTIEQKIEFFSWMHDSRMELSKLISIIERKIGENIQLFNFEALSFKKFNLVKGHDIMRLMNELAFFFNCEDWKDDRMF